MRQYEIDSQENFDVHLMESGYIIGISESLKAFNPTYRIGINFDQLHNRLKRYPVISFYANLNDQYDFLVTREHPNPWLYATNSHSDIEHLYFKKDNLDKVKAMQLLDQKEIYDLLIEIFSFSSEIEVVPFGSSDTKISITTEPNLETNLAVSTLTEELIRTIRRINYKYFEIDDGVAYRCFSCNREISFEGNYCDFCGILSPKCVICFEDPEPNDDISIFQCCGSYVHEKHGDLWLEQSNHCPYCRSKKIKMIKIPKT